MDRFEFIFQGTYEQFEFFKYIATKKIPDSGLTLDNYVGDEFHCSINPFPNAIFKMGIIISSCYAKFDRLEGTVFSNSYPSPTAENP